MSRQNYEMLSERHYLDLNTGKVVTKSERHNPNITHIPFYFWGEDTPTKVVTGLGMENGNLVDTFSYQNYITVLKLYGMQIILRNMYDASITFYDTVNKVHHDLDVKVKPYHSHLRLRGGDTGTKVDKVLYELTFDKSNTASFVTDLSDRESFKPIAFLAHLTSEKMPKTNTIMFSYGLAYKPYTVESKGRTLDGSCYAFVYGCCAILLKDNDSFDAFVLLKGCNSDKLIVDKFIYTNNVYIVKVITLWKESQDEYNQ